MLKFTTLLGLLLTQAYLAGCATVQRSAVATTAKVIYQASEEIETEANWELFRQSVPSNLKLLEGLFHVNPKSEALVVSLIKGYVGYAFAVHETLALEEQLSRSYPKVHHQQAVEMYSKAIRYGIFYLENAGLEEVVLSRAMRRNNGIPEELSQHLSSKKKLDLEAVFFTAQALGSLINLQRDDMVLVSQLPIAKGMFDWVCQHQPDIHHGACDLFYGAYEAGRPAMLGGNPDEGKKLFEKAIERNPDNWLIPLSFLQYYALPQYDEKIYQQWRPKFQTWLNEFDQGKRWRPGQSSAPEFRENRLNLYRAIALKRFQIIQRYEKSLF
jgi:tetratricopeptide (TPR) repeat protein